MTQSTESTIEKTKDAIEETRDRVRDRVNSLQDDLSPAALLDRFAPEGQPLSESIRQVGDAAKRNPLATALLAGGAMLLGREVLSGSNGRITTHADEQDAAARVGKHVKSARDATAEMVQTAAEMKDAVKRKAVKGVDAASETAEDLIRSTKQQANSAYRSASRAVQSSTTDAAKAASTGRRWVEDNPVAAGLACVAVGALAASFFAAKPISDYREDEDDHDDDHYQPVAKPTRTRTASSRTVGANEPAARKTAKLKKAKRSVNPRGAKSINTGVKTRSASAVTTARPTPQPQTSSPTASDSRPARYTDLSK